LIDKQSAKEYAHIGLGEYGHIHFNNALGFVEEKIWSAVNTGAS